MPGEIRNVDVDIDHIHSPEAKEVPQTPVAEESLPAQQEKGEAKLQITPALKEKAMALMEFGDEQSAINPEFISQNHLEEAIKLIQDTSLAGDFDARTAAGNRLYELADAGYEAMNNAKRAAEEARYKRK